MAAREAVHLFQQLGQGHARVLAGKIGRDEIRLAKKQVGLNPDMRKRVGTYSLGMRQRLGLARAFLHDAPFLLLDEPTSNLDSLNEAVILKSLREEREGKTVVLVSHRQSTMRIADTVYSVEHGRMS